MEEEKGQVEENAEEEKEEKEEKEELEKKKSLYQGGNESALSTNTGA